jgi:3-oxoacyl-[acyl-carrier-protein] synthase-3
MSVRIRGTGSYLPKRVVTNHEIATLVETSDEWIRQRVGIIERRVASEQETCAFIATAAAKEAIDASGISVDQIGLVIVATSTPDYMMPSMACAVQAALNIPDCTAFDVNAACSGFVYALTVAKQFIDAGTVKHALVIGAERISRVLNWKDRGTCVLFGDGGGAVVLSTDTNPGIISTHLHSAGEHRDLLYVPNNLSPKPFQKEVPEAHLTMEGNKVFKYAVSMLGEVVEEVLARNHLTKDQIDWLIPHQANERIISATAKKLDLSMDKVVLTLPYHGNTSAASIPLALDTAVRDGRIKRGDLLLLEAFGAGFVWGAVLVRY